MQLHFCLHLIYLFGVSIEISGALRPHEHMFIPHFHLFIIQHFSTSFSSFNIILIVQHYSRHAQACSFVHLILIHQHSLVFVAFWHILFHQACFIQHVSHIHQHHMHALIHCLHVFILIIHLSLIMMHNVQLNHQSHLIMHHTSNMRTKHHTFITPSSHNSFIACIVNSYPINLS